MRQWAVFLLFVSAFVIIALFLSGNALNNALLWLTGVVVLFYTVETQGLRLEMVRQNEMAIQPLVIATIEDRETQRTAIGSESVLVLRNIGRGAALFVKISDVDFAELEGQPHVMKFDSIDYIEPGKDMVMHPNIFHRDEQTASRGYVSHLDPRYSYQSLMLNVMYEDIDGQRRESVVKMGKGGIRLLKHGRRE